MERPNRSDIEAAVRRILMADLKVSAEVLATSDTSTPLLGRGIGLDSIEAVSLALGLERDFAIEIADADLTTDSFQTIDTLIDYIDRKIGKHPA